MNRADRLAIVCKQQMISTMMSSDPVLDEKVKKLSGKISENMHIIANDPSLAFYRIQEHIRRVMPMIVERRAEVEELQQDLQGRCYDLEYSLGAIKTMDHSESSFANIHELLKSSIFLKQQLRGEETRRRSNTANSQSSSVYKRLSAHIQTTLDLPELDFSGAIRETTSRMENMMGSTARSSAHNSSRKSSSGSSTEGIQRSHTTLH